MASLPKAFQPYREAEKAPVPIAEGFHATHGREPRTGETKLQVQFRCGYVDDRNTYTAKQLRWTDTGDSYDIIAVRRAS